MCIMFGILVCITNMVAGWWDALPGCNVSTKRSLHSKNFKGGGDLQMDVSTKSHYATQNCPIKNFKGDGDPSDSCKYKTVTAQQICH